MGHHRTGQYRQTGRVHCRSIRGKSHLFLPVRQRASAGISSGGHEHTAFPVRYHLRPCTADPIYQGPDRCGCVQKDEILLHLPESRQRFYRLGTGACRGSDEERDRSRRIRRTVHRTYRSGQSASCGQGQPEAFHHASCRMGKRRSKNTADGYHILPDPGLFPPERFLIHLFCIRSVSITRIPPHAM